MSKIKVKFKKTRDDAVLPRKAKKEDVGFDIFAPKKSELRRSNYDVLCQVEKHDELMIMPNTVTKIPTGISFAAYIEDSINRDSKLYVKIEGRSGLASKGVFPIGGIIDPGYRGDLTVMLANIGCGPVVIPIDKAIAQFVIYCVETDAEVEEVDEIEFNSDRGDAGFGSTDKQ